MNPLYLIVTNASGYIEEKDLNTLYLNIDYASGYIKEKGVNKYLVFDSTDESKELQKKYSDVWNGIKNKIKNRQLRTDISDLTCYQRNRDLILNKKRLL